MYLCNNIQMCTCELLHSCHNFSFLIILLVATWMVHKTILCIASSNSNYENDIKSQMIQSYILIQLVCQSVRRGPETQISSVRLSRSWNLDLHLFVCRGLETQIPSVHRGPETQIPSVRLSKSWNPNPKLRYPIDSRTAKVWKSVPRTRGPKNYSGP
jgi:hypothetical protein